MNERLLANLPRRGHATRIVAAMMKRARATLAVVSLLAVSALIAGCGGGGGDTAVGGGTGAGGGGVSPQTVNGVAATGAPLPGVVSLKDSSSPSREKTTVIASDGSFAVDVSDMSAPFVLKATGTVNGTNRTMYSFAPAAGTANINPLSSAAVASAAGVDDPGQVYDRPDLATREKLKTALPGTIATLRLQLKPLLAAYNADNDDPISSQFRADHNGLDGVFDNVRITLADGTLTITNATTGAVIFTAQVRDIEHGKFTDNDDDLPRNGARPAAPTGVTAKGGDTQVTITWDSVSNATSYEIYWSTKSDDVAEEGSKISNVTSPYVHTGLAPNTTYYYVIRGINSAGKSPASARVSATTTSAMAASSLPAAPAGVTAAGGTRQTTISWSAASGATSYDLYWSTTNGVTTTNGTKISGVTSPAVHTGLTDGTTYYYIVTAVNSAGESLPSVQAAATTLAATTPVSSAPAAPAGVSAAGGANQVTVLWGAVSGANSYNLYWSTTAGVTIATGTKISGVTSPYVHSGLSAGTTYYYIITAVNTSGESTASAEASATTNAAASSLPAAPTGVTAAGGTQQVTISWSAVSGATSYNLYWATTTGVTTTTGTKIAGVTSPSYVQTGLADGTAYFYIVTAVNSAGEGAASSQATATTSAATPAAINGATLYMAANSCVACHNGSLDPANSSHITGSDKQGTTAALITSGIANIGSMRTRFNATNGTVFKLTPEQIAAIATALQ